MAEGMEGLKAIPFLALVLAISGIVIGSGAVVLSKFGDTTQKCETATHTYNITKDYCCLQPNGAATINYCTKENNSNVTLQYRTVLEGLDAESEVGAQLPTVGIIAVMVVIISIIASVFVYLKYFQG